MPAFSFLRKGLVKLNVKQRRAKTDEHPDRHLSQVESSSVMEPVSSGGVLEHATNFDALKHGQHPACTVERLSIAVEDSSVRGFLHLPGEYRQNQSRNAAAAILLSGAGGGVAGPSSMYVSMGDKLASLRRGIPVLRLDYRHDAQTEPCVNDVTSAMNFLDRKYSVKKFVLVGWSFGGAPVFTVGGKEKERVVGCATVASQTRAVGGIRQLPPRPVLLLHGTGDQTLSASCSRALYEAYGSGGDITLKLFPDDDHSLRKNSLEAEVLLCNFIAKCVGEEIDQDEQDTVLGRALIAGKDKEDLMKQGGDLRGEEHLE